MGRSTKKYRGRLSSQSGLSLVELAIALVVVGLLTMPMIQIYNQWKIDKIQGTTEDNTTAIKAAITEFYFANGRYPCPADPTIAITANGYGQEVACAAVNGAAPWSNNATVAQGAVPVAALKLPEKVSLDGFSNKLLYAVTRNQTATATYTPAGAIRVNWFYWESSAVPPYEGNRADPADPLYRPALLTSHYVLVSHGDNRAGAYDVNGNLIDPCLAGENETENCNDDTTFLMPEYRRSAITGGSYYDDFAVVQYETPSRIWTYSQTDPDNILTTVDRVGIGGNTAPAFDLDVLGNIRADGDISVTRMCNPANNQCFNIRWITNPPTAGVTKCLNGTVLKSIPAGSWMTSCGGIPIPNNAPTGNCGAGYAIGVSGTGVLICHL